MRWPWQPKPAPQPRADRTRIAELEYELFGVEPKPNTVAAFAVGLRRAFGPDLGGPLPGYSDGNDLSRMPIQPMPVHRPTPSAPQRTPEKAVQCGLTYIRGRYGLKE